MRSPFLKMLWSGRDRRRAARSALLRKRISDYTVRVVVPRDRKDWPR